MQEHAVSPPVRPRPGSRALEKIKPLEQLGLIAEEARRSGKTIALCHGVFDLVHLGHVRHIEGGRQLADLLIVTCTADAHVNRGPGRPVFRDEMRAEMLASLTATDFVGINHAATAEMVIRTIKPDFYVKGQDYENPEDDVTGKINDERRLVESFGGRVVFTQDVTFSSSQLLNRHFETYEPTLKAHLDEVREGGGAERLMKLINKIADMKVVLVGDTIIDEYQYVTGLGKASKENLVATLFRGNEVFAGGVIAAANHVASFCREVEVVTTLGMSDSYEDLVRRSLKPNVKLSPVMLEGRPTTRKMRMVDQGYLQKLFEVYFMDDSPVGDGEREQITSLIGQRAAAGDVVIVTDFGHGLIDSTATDMLSEVAPFLAVNAQSNSGNHGYNPITRYKRADYICIDAPEARLAIADKFSDIATVIERGLRARIDCPNIVVTHGSHGCYPYADGVGVTRVPAFTKQVVDTVGAGDAFFVVTAPLVAAGGDIRDVAFVGNAVGALKVGIVGHRSSVDKPSLLKYVTRLLK